MLNYLYFFKSIGAHLLLIFKKHSRLKITLNAYTHTKEISILRYSFQRNTIERTFSFPFDVGKIERALRGKTN